jgi:hypothetical protein
VALEEPMSVAVPPSRVDGRSDDHTIPPPNRLPDIPGTSKLDGIAAFLQGLRDRRGDLSSRAGPGGERHENAAHDGHLLIVIVRWFEMIVNRRTEGQ